MLTRYLVLWMFSVVILGLSAGGVSGQNYPMKPVRIVTAEPGGITDLVARLLTPGLTSSLGQPVIVENRVNLIATETVMKAPPDGYSLYLGASGFIYGPLLREIFYDPVRDFLPVALTTTAPNVLVVNLSLPVKSVKELIALAKAKPGELNYASTSPGGASHLAAELFKYMAGVNIVNIRYKGAGQATTDVIGGHVQLTFGSAGELSAQIRAGKVRALAITSERPSVLFPGLPPIAASGLPGYATAQITGIWAPAKTPTAIITQLNQEIVRILNRADVKEKFLNVNVEVVGSSPEEAAAMIKSEVTKMSKLIKDAGIKAE